MSDARIRRVVICGGGTAGWMTAAALAKMLGTRDLAITLVESAEIGTVGVGEATIPPIVQFNQMLGIDEARFVRETHATFKLGIEFADWLRPGHRYMHPFGLFGADMNETTFTHFWVRAVAAGMAPDLMPFSAEMQAAYQGRFAPSGGDKPGGPKIHYAYQFDAAAYAAFLRRFAEALGVTRVEGRIATVDQDGESGFLTAVTLADGQQIAGDLFVDCTGFRALLIEQTLGAGHEDWSHWLPCNRAVAMPSERVGEPVPYTRTIAREAGWQWRIPLQHRTGNGYVFCDAFLSEQDAADLLAQRLEGPALDAPRTLKFVAGRRRRNWIGNCIAIGLSSGFLEPLESTSIHLIQIAITWLLSMFPDRHCDPAIVARFNADMEQQTSGIRDFLIAHYKLTERDDTPFWRQCRMMDIPDTLAAKLALFAERGEVFPRTGELFKEVNWFAVLHGQGIAPRSWHALAGAMPEADLRRNMAAIAGAITRRVTGMPPHQAFLDRCSAAIAR